jgi:hypothetical protein
MTPVGEERQPATGSGQEALRQVADRREFVAVRRGRPEGLAAGRLVVRTARRRGVNSWFTEASVNKAEQPLDELRIDTWS